MKGSLMGVYINTRICFAFFFLFCLTWFATTDAVACDSCGRECANACGTKHFRTCCFNYLRKRSAPSNEPPNEILVESEYAGYAIPPEFLNEVFRTDQDWDSFSGQTSHVDRMNRKRHPHDNNMDYP